MGGEGAVLQTVILLGQCGRDTWSKYAVARLPASEY